MRWGKREGSVEHKLLPGEQNMPMLVDCFSGLEITQHGTNHCSLFSLERFPVCRLLLLKSCCFFKTVSCPSEFSCLFFQIFTACLMKNNSNGLHLPILIHLGKWHNATYSYTVFQILLGGLGQACTQISNFRSVSYF